MLLIVNFVDIYRRWMKKNEDIHHSFISIFDWNKRLFHWTGESVIYAYDIRCPDILLPFTGFLGTQWLTLTVSRSSAHPQVFVQDNRLV